MSDEHEKLVNDTIAHNLAEADEHGPGLRYTTRTVILARDPARRMILEGGFGPFGVGEIWSPEEEDDKNRPGYDTCPIVEYREDADKKALGKSLASESSAMQAKRAE